MLQLKDFEQDFSLKSDFSRRHLCPNPPALAGGRLRFIKEIDEINLRQISQKKLSSKYLFLKDAYKDHQDVINKAIVELIDRNKWSPGASISRCNRIFI